MEDANDDEITALFVEAFGDQERFFNVCLKELEKAEDIIAVHMDRSNMVNGPQYGLMKMKILKKRCPKVKKTEFRCCWIFLRIKIL